MAETSHAEYLANQTLGALDEGDKILDKTVRDPAPKQAEAQLAYQRATVLALLSLGERIAELQDVVFALGEGA